MATRSLALGQNIQTAITAGAAGDTYNLASGIYYGQGIITPKAGDFYIGVAGGGTVLSGACLIRTAQWTNVSANWYKATQGSVDTQATVTMTIASPCVVSWANVFVDGQPIAFTTTGALPTGIVAGTTYYVKTPNTSTFNLAATPGGTAIVTTGTQSGVHTGCAAGGGLATFTAPQCLWKGTATISGTTLTIVSTVSGTFTANGGQVGGQLGATLYGNGLTQPTNVVSGAGSTWTISASQTVSVARPMVLLDQQGENAPNGALADNPLAYLEEELFVDNVRYTRAQAAAVSTSNGAAAAAPAVNTWFWDWADSSVNINLASPGTHIVEYGQTIGLINVDFLVFTFKNMTWEKYGGWPWVAISSAGGHMTFLNCTGRQNKTAAINCGPSSFLEIYGGHYNDNGENGIVGSPIRGRIDFAEVSRNNIPSQWYSAYQAGGIKLTNARNITTANCICNNNNGPGIWGDISCARMTYSQNICLGNTGPGIMYEISFDGTIFDNIVGAGLFDNPAALELGIYISNSFNVDCYDNVVIVRAANAAGGGIQSLNDLRGSWGASPRATFTGSVSGNTLTVAATLTGTVALNQLLYGAQVPPGTIIISQLTGTTGSTGTYQLSTTLPTITSVPMVSVDEFNTVLWETRNVKVHHNTITYLGAAGAQDGFGVIQPIVGGSTRYLDYNTYYTPNATSQFWYSSTDAGVTTHYTWAAYQAAGFEPNSQNFVGVAPGALLPPTPSPYMRGMLGPVTIVPLDVSTVTTGGTAVAALTAGHCTAGGRIQNPLSAGTSLGINQNGTASGTTSNGSTIFYPPGATCWLVASANAVSVISSDSAHPFAGEGWQ
jgi:hypothetical protein